MLQFWKKCTFHGCFRHQRSNSIAYNLFFGKVCSNFEESEFPYRSVSSYHLLIRILRFLYISILSTLPPGAAQNVICRSLAWLKLLVHKREGPLRWLEWLEHWSQCCMPVACQLPLAFAFRGLHGTAVPTHCPLLLTFVKAMARLSRVLKRPLGGLAPNYPHYRVLVVIWISIFTKALFWLK